jgi:hypothetical protein
MVRSRFPRLARNSFTISSVRMQVIAVRKSLAVTKAGSLQIGQADSVLKPGMTTYSMQTEQAMQPHTDSLSGLRRMSLHTLHFRCSGTGSALLRVGQLILLIASSVGSALIVSANFSLDVSHSFLVPLDRRTRVKTTVESASHISPSANSLPSTWESRRSKLVSLNLLLLMKAILAES